MSELAGLFQYEVTFDDMGHSTVQVRADGVNVGEGMLTFWVSDETSRHREVAIYPTKTVRRVEMIEPAATNRPR